MSMSWDYLRITGEEDWDLYQLVPSIISPTEKEDITEKNNIIKKINNITTNSNDNYNIKRKKNTPNVLVGFKI